MPESVPIDPKTMGLLGPPDPAGPPGVDGEPGTPGPGTVVGLVFEPLPFGADEEPGLVDDAPVPLAAFVFSGTAAPLPDGADDATAEEEAGAAGASGEEGTELASTSPPRGTPSPASGAVAVVDPAGTAAGASEPAAARSSA